MTTMAAYLVGFVLPSSFFSNSTTSTGDDDFFNEPSVMRLKLTAAAANRKDNSTSPVAVSPRRPSSPTYSVTARGTGMMHYAAMMA